MSKQCSHRSALVLTIASCIGMYGCANLPGSNDTSKVAEVPRMVTTDYYPRCYQPIEELRRYDASSRMAKRQEEARTLGILAGAALGAVAGAALDGKRGALLGGIAGAGIAALITGQQTDAANQQAQRDRENVADKYADYIGGDVSDMDLTLAAARKAQDCYQQQYTKLLKDKKRRRMNADEGRARLNEIVAGLQETNNLIATVDGYFTENIAAYTQSYEESLHKSGLQRSEVAQTVKAQPVSGKRSSGKRGKTAAAARSDKSPVKTASNPAIPKEAQNAEKKLQQAEATKVEVKKVKQAGATQVQKICNNADAGDWAPKDKCAA